MDGWVSAAAAAAIQRLVDQRSRVRAAEIYGRRHEESAVGDGHEAIAADGTAGPRSARLVRYLSEMESQPPNGSVRNYGCGNGAFLAFGEAARGGTWDARSRK